MVLVSQMAIPWSGLTVLTSQFIFHLIFAYFPRICHYIGKVRISDEVKTLETTLAFDQK